MKQEKTPYLSIGIDIGADFSLMAAALPTQEIVCRSYKILHSSTRSVTGSGGPYSVHESNLACEIGNFAAFRHPKQIYSYFGLDPVVRQSGNSAESKLRISKRSFPYVRRCFYMLALQAVSLRKNGEPNNPVLCTYYQEKCRSKAKITALGAVMHKLYNIVFVVLQDERPFVLISPQEHRQNYLAQANAA